MFCQRCGQAIADGSTFCPFCGATQAAPPPPPVAPMPAPAPAPMPAPAPVVRRLPVKWIVIGVVVIILAGIAIASTLLVAIRPPVAVYDRPTPSGAATPESLLPASVAGANLVNFVTNQYSDAVDAIGFYEANIRIAITKFFDGPSASAYMEALTSQYRAQSGSLTSQKSGDQHWFTFTGGGESVFAWRKVIWVFEVYAPNEGLRNQVASEFPY